MKQLNKILITTVVVASLATGAAIAYGKSDRHGDHMIDHIAEHLDLDNTQEAALTEMMDDLHNYRDDLRDSAREQIRAAVMQASLSQEDALKLIELRQQNHQQANNFLASKIAAFHAILNAEQREKAADMMVANISRHGAHHRGWRHGGKHDHDKHHDDDKHHGWHH